MLYRFFTRKTLFLYLCFAALLFLVGGIFYLNFSYLSKAFLPFSPDRNMAPITLLRLKILLLSMGIIGAILALLLIVPINWIKKADLLLAPKNQTRFVLSVFILAFLLRFVWIISTPDVLEADPGWYNNAAHILASEGRYADTEHDNKTTASFPVGYPLFLSLIFRLANHSHFAGKFANIILSLLISYLSYLISLKIADRKFANLVLILVAFSPSQIFFVRLFLSEILFGFLLILFLYLLLNRERIEKRFLSLFAAGIILGLATLTRPLTLLLPLVVLVFYVRFRLPVLKSFYQVAIISLGMFLVLSPWMMRNKRVMNYSFISTNGGVDLWVGNNPQANGSYNWPAENPFDSLRNESSADRLGLKLGMEYIKTNPSRFILSGIRKEIYLFAGDLYALYRDLIKVAGANGPSAYVGFALISQIYYSIIFLFFLGGIFVYLFKRIALDLRWSLLFYTLVYWCVVHFIFFGEDRFHFPIMPIMVMFAAAFAKYLHEKIVTNTARL